MAVRTVVHFNNFPEITDQLEPATKQLVATAATLIYDKTQMIVPVDTEALRNSGRIEEIDHGYRIVYDAENSSGMSYAGFVEYGTSYTRAQPYMGPGFEQAMPEIIDKATHFLDDFI